MLRKNTFLENLEKYFEVVDAYLKNKLPLELSEIEAIHFHLNTGQDYLSKKDDKLKILKKYKFSLLNNIVNLTCNRSTKKALYQIDINELHLRLTNLEKVA